MMHRGRSLSIAAAIVLLALVAQAQAKISKGDPAPPFELKSVGGDSVSTQTLAGGGMVILTFISLDSKPSRELAVSLDGLVKEHGKRGMTVVAIAADPADKLKDFTSKQAPGLTACSDGSKETIRRYGAENIVPMTYLIGPGGTIAEVVPGGGAGVQQVLMAIAAKEFARGNAAVASDLYGDVVKSDPKNVEARAGLGFALAKEGKLERAEEEFKSLEGAGGDAKVAAAEGLADVKLKKGDLDGALAQIAKVPDSSFGHVVKGQEAAKRGDLNQAAKEFDTATKGKPSLLAWQKGVAFNNLANVSREKGDAKGAIKGYDEALKEEPFLVEAKSNKGAAQQKSGNLSEARKTLAEAKALAPSDQLVATLLRRVEEQEKAKVDIEKQKLQNQLVNELVAAYKSGKPAPAPADDWAPRALVVSFLDFKSKLGPLGRDGLEEAFVLNVTRRLQDSGRVKVVERELIDKLLAELKLGSSELADPATRLKLGRVFAATVIGTGGFYPAAAKTELQLRLIDTETTDIRASLSENLSDPAAVSTFADQIADKILAKLRGDYPLKGKIASVEGGEIIVGIGRKHGAQEGARLKVVEDGAPVEVDGEVLGRKQRTVGMLEVTKVEDAFAYAKPVDGSGFAKGQHLIEAAK